MKKAILLTSFYVFLLIYLTACASNNSTSNKNSKNPEAKLANLYFDDWQYKGFGKDVPHWIFAALEENPSELNNIVQKNFPELKNFRKSSEFEAGDFEENLLVEKIMSSGLFLDQCQKRHKKIVKNMKSENYVLLDEFWVHINPDYKMEDEPYLKYSLFYKIN